MNRTGRCGQDCACDSVCACAAVGTTSAASAAIAMPKPSNSILTCMLSQADASPREYRRRGRTVNATHLPMFSDATHRSGVRRIDGIRRAQR